MHYGGISEASRAETMQRAWFPFLLIVSLFFLWGMAMGAVSDAYGIHWAMAVPLVCFIIIFGFAQRCLAMTSDAGTR